MLTVQANVEYYQFDSKEGLMLKASRPDINIKIWLYSSQIECQGVVNTQSRKHTNVNIEHSGIETLVEIYRVLQFITSFAGFT